MRILKEVWKKIRGYTGYEVSNLGRIKSNGRKIIQSNGHPITLPSKILKLCVSDRGYLYVVLTENNKHNTKRVHRLVAEAFIQNPYNKPQVHHINHVKSDNRADNLMWVTSKENVSFEQDRTFYIRDSHGRFLNVRVRGEDKMVFVLSDNNTVIAVFSNKENARTARKKLRGQEIKITAVPFCHSAKLN